jgi:outer membrane protein OmpA-like peptidoglycan-associated protein
LFRLCGLRFVAGLVVLSLGWGPRDAAAQQVQDLRFRVEPLRFQVRDVRFAVQDLRFTLGDMAFELEDITAPAEETDRELRFRLSADVLFDFDSPELRPEAEPVLQALAERLLGDFAGAEVRIEGHTDAVGSESYNQDLALRRAESVKMWLVERGGIDAGRITTSGLGEAAPVVPNQHADGTDDPVGRQQNRRVEIVVEKIERG